MKIELTETEIVHILDALTDRINVLGGAEDTPMVNDEIAELEELSFDLFESMSRHDDDWGRENDAIPDAAAAMIEAGIDAREQVKASSRAATRRDELLARGVSNDPIDW